MSLDYTYVTPEGEEKTDSVHALSMQARDAGYNPQTISPDGMSMTLQDEHGPYTVAVKDMLKSFGHQVKDVKPQEGSLDEQGINPWWRYAINNISDEGVKKAYLADKLREHGVKDPQIIGEGRDFHLWNPEAGKWVALTNSRHWGDSLGADLAEVASEGTKALGTGIGAVAAGVGSGGLATAAGAAGGSAVGNALTHGVAALDPAYRKNIDVGSELKHGALTAGIDAALMGGGALAGKGLGKAAKYLSEEGYQGAGKLLGNIKGAGEAVAKNGPVGAALENAGTIGKPIAGAGEFVSRKLDNAIAKDVLAAGAVPAVSGVTGAASMAQLPGWLTRSAPEFAQWLAKRPMAQKVFGREAMSGLESGAGDLLKSAKPGAATSEEVLANLAEKIQEARGKISPWAKGEAKPLSRAAKSALPEDLAGWTEEQVAKNRAAARATGGKVGAAFDAAEKAGEVAQNVIRVPISAGLKGAQAAFFLGKHGARGAQAVGRGLRSVEVPAYLKAASDYNLGPRAREWLGEENQSRIPRRSVPFSYGPGGP